MKKLTTFIITSMLWVGCTNPPHESDKLTLGLVQATVIKGANQTEITKVLGAPNIISKDKQGRETWTYDRISRNSEAKSGSMVGAGFFSGFIGASGTSKSSASTSSKSLTVVITFDNDKSVVDYAYQSLEF